MSEEEPAVASPPRDQKGDPTEDKKDICECPHVRQTRVCQRTDLLHPRNWACTTCGTTESVWACLTCSNMGCGWESQGHAHKHFQSSRHPLAIEVNEKYVHCYLCNEWVMNDTVSRDIALFQSMLEQVASQSYHQSTTRSGHVIRPAAAFMRMDSRVEEALSHTADRKFTADAHWKYLQLSRLFSAWKQYTLTEKEERRKRSSSQRDTPQDAPPPSPAPSSQKRHMLTPGMTGLRNLGNTCYMNSALQALGHLPFLREAFRQMGQTMTSCPSTPSCSSSTKSFLFNRQTTIECFQHISTKPDKSRSKGLCRQQPITGLSGGRGGSLAQNKREEIDSAETELSSLCRELHGLVRVMWSGKWAVVTPHTVLTSIWQHLPSFRGYCQQDAQEFLCGLLSSVHQELQCSPPDLLISVCHSSRDIVFARELLPALFQGQLTSTVTYQRCGHQSMRVEPFWDLSLEFPERYHCGDCTGRRGTSVAPCNLTELLSQFTSDERIDDCVLTCDHCQGQPPQCGTKNLRISTPPEVLRLHLKRFRYSGLTWQKITVGVAFPLELDLQPFYMSCNQEEVDIYQSHDHFLYDLSGVVVHHGLRFSCGHYTAYCWNSQAGSWVHCNDSRLSRCSFEDVLQSQAYLLFYCRRLGRSPVLNRPVPSSEQGHIDSDVVVGDLEPCPKKRRTYMYM